MASKLKDQEIVSVSDPSPVKQTFRGRPTTISKQGLETLLRKHTKTAIRQIIRIMKTSRNESLRLEASRIILNKTLPDVKAVQLHAEITSKPYTVLMGNGFIPEKVVSEASDIVEGKFESEASIPIEKTEIGG